MAADNNKVEFGLSNLYVGTYTVAAGGTVTLGTPYHQAGAVSLSLDAESDSNDFYADNVKYWSGYSDQAERIHRISDRRRCRGQTCYPV